MRSNDWKPKETAKVLVIGEDPNLQWCDTLPEYVMFTDYYFRKIPYDLGERSRYMEAKKLFEMVEDLTEFKYKYDEVYVTCLCCDSLARPAKGKRTLIPEQMALKGVEHIKWILQQNPEIEVIFALSQQTNYWLQKSGFAEADEQFLKAAEPRRTGLQDIMPYYQPVNPKVFNEICAKLRYVNNYRIKLFPLLPMRDYPLRGDNVERFEKSYALIKEQL